MLKINLKLISISIIINYYNKNESFETFIINNIFNFSYHSFIFFVLLSDIKSSSPSGESEYQNVLIIIFRYEKIKNKES